ncbi:MAG: methyltransferase [Caulobacter sp.]|nr:methyltransferase [Caulobacter sp.]
MDIESFIRERLPVCPVADLPGLRLHLAAPHSGLSQLDGPSPYWAHLWGGGLALGRFLRERPETVAGRRVMDLGTGSGVAAIIAAQAGGHLTAVDIDPRAVVVVRLNAALNGVGLDVRQDDLLAGPAPDVDCILVSDLFYDRALAGRVTPFLDRCLAAKIEVLVGDPWRMPLPTARLEVLAEYRVADFGRGAGPAAVFRFLGPT